MWPVYLLINELPIRQWKLRENTLILWNLDQNSMQFNRKCGCWHCLQTGETYHTGTGGHCHVFPFIPNEPGPDGPLRTSTSVQTNVKAAIQKIQDRNNQYVTNGIKGPFWFTILSHFNCVDGMVIDYMHGICSGVMKLLLSL